MAAESATGNSCGTYRPVSLLCVTALLVCPSLTPHALSHSVYSFLLSKMADFWVVAPHSLVEVYRRFRGACCRHHQGDEWESLKSW
jgi:hypothetical protein